MISIKDIAGECGVSIATVSKALNNHKDVSEATKQLVRDTAKRLGYLPNSQARALKTNKTYNIGVLLVENADSGLEHSYFSSVLNSFKREAEKHGYDITFISGNVGELDVTYYEHCLYRNVDGVFIACGDFYSDNVRSLLDSPLPLVTIDFISDKKPSVVSDNVQGMGDLVRYVSGKGHTKIAYIYGDVSDVTNARIKGYKEALEQLGLTYRDEYMVKGKYLDPVKTERVISELLKLPDPPTCIILPDDFSAVGAMNALEEMGMSVPDDISIAGYDGILLSRVLRPKLTTIRQDTERLGREAAKLLISLMRKEISADTPPVVIPGYILEGDSVKEIT